MANIKIIFVSLACLSPFGMAQGQVAEIRAGVSQFDEDITGIDWAIGFADETSIGINADVVFDEPKILKWALSPQPYIGGMVNLEGKTSYGAAGLLWRQNMGEKFYADVSFGLAVHDGTLKLPRLQSDTIQRLFEEIEFGSRVLFKPQIGAGYKISDEWAVEIFYEHLSHARLLSDRANDGADIVGTRLAKRF